MQASGLLSSPHCPLLFLYAIEHHNEMHLVTHSSEQCCENSGRDGYLFHFPHKVALLPDLFNNPHGVPQPNEEIQDLISEELNSVQLFTA